MINFCLNQLKSSLQVELNQFFQIKEKRETPIHRVTASALTKARAKFSHTAFIELNQLATGLFYESAAIQQWHGFRVLAIDGSKYRLPEVSDMTSHFGGQRHQGLVTTMALGSCLYDVFQGIPIDAILAPYKDNERELAYAHLAQARPGDLILYDRGYPAFWLFSAHRQQQLHFCMRVKSNFNKETEQFIQSGAKQAVVTLTPTADSVNACQEKGLSTQPMSVRLLRVKTRKDDYILMTNLIDQQAYPFNSFDQLYHQRWQVEEGYKQQKSWMEMENFTGKTVHAVQQDFHARILNLTLAALTAFEATAYLKSSIQHRQALYKINRAQTFSSMRNTLARCLFGMLSDLSLTQWLRTLAKSLSIIRPNRCFRRNKKVSTARFHPNYKRCL